MSNLSLIALAGCSGSPITVVIGGSEDGGASTPDAISPPPVDTSPPGNIDAGDAEHDAGAAEGTDGGTVDVTDGGGCSPIPIATACTQASALIQVPTECRYTYLSDFCCPLPKNHWPFAGQE
jgi:hypothetical protein